MVSLSVMGTTRFGGENTSKKATPWRCLFAYFYDAVVVAVVGAVVVKSTDGSSGVPWMV